MNSAKEDFELIQVPNHSLFDLLSYKFFLFSAYITIHSLNCLMKFRKMLQNGLNRKSFHLPINRLSNFSYTDSSILEFDKIG